MRRRPFAPLFTAGIGGGSRHAIVRLLSTGDPRRQRNRAPSGAPREFDVTSDREIRVHWRRALALAAMLCAASPLYGQEPIPVGDMSTPESALHDPEADVYLVSNINGGPGDRDDNGFISRVSPDGQVLDLKWIDGADPGVTLHAPKGSAVYGDRFYMADIDVVRRFDRTSGAPLGAWAVPNAGFLNDVAVGADGTVYVTDTGIAITAQGFAPTGTAAIYRFDAGGEARVIAQGDALALPNGIIDTPQGLVMVPVGGNTVVGVAPDGELTVVVELPQGQLDGVVALEDGSLVVVSSFGANAIYHVSSSGAVTEILSDTPAADIGFDAGRSRVLIPQLDNNRLLHLPGGSRLRPAPLHGSPHRRHWTHRFGDGSPFLTDARRRTSPVTARRWMPLTSMILTRDASPQVGQQALMIQVRPAGRCARARDRDIGYARRRAPQPVGRSASARFWEPVSRRSAVGVNHTRPMTVLPAPGWVSSLVTMYATESSSALSRLAPSMWASRASILGMAPSVTSKWSTVVSKWSPSRSRREGSAAAKLWVASCWASSAGR